MQLRADISFPTLLENPTYFLEELLQIQRMGILRTGLTRLLLILQCHLVVKWWQPEMEQFDWSNKIPTREAAIKA